MKTRRAGIELDVVKLRKMTAYDIGCLFQELPDDAKLVHLGDDLATASSVFIFESEEFKEVKEGERYPLIEVKFSEAYKMGESFNQYELDLEPVLEVKPDEDEFSDVVAKATSECMKKWASEAEKMMYITIPEGFLVDETKLTPTSISRLSDKPEPTENVEYKDSVIKVLKDGIYAISTDYDIDNFFYEKGSKNLFETKKTAIIQNIPTECDHEWKKYEGLMFTYDYCSKCDQKKT